MMEKNAVNGTANSVPGQGWGTGQPYKNIDKYFSSPKSLGNITSKQMYEHLIANGYDPQPLSGGSLKGILYQDGGGYKVIWGGDRILQYHPAGGHHGGNIGNCHRGQPEQCVMTFLEM